MTIGYEFHTKQKQTIDNFHVIGLQNMNKGWIQKAEEVVNEGFNAIILTNKEILFKINEACVKNSERISINTFTSWRKHIGDLSDDKISPLEQKFLQIFMGALIRQKNLIFEKYFDSEDWKKWAWIIERKFEEWNLKSKQEIDHSGGVNITSRSAGMSQEELEQFVRDCRENKD